MHPRMGDNYTCIAVANIYIAIVNVHIGLEAPMRFMQCAGGLQDGVTRCAQLLNMLHDLPTDDQDPDDPVTFINTDIKAAFQEMCRQASFDTLTGPGYITI
jgi:hypothetical protein